MKIALVVSEAVPFAKTGGLADVCGALPLALEELGEEVVVVMPKYLSAHKSGLIMKKFDQDFDVATMGVGVKVYLVKHDMYLREGLYGDKFGDYSDNLRRFSYLCQKSLELLAKIDFVPDIIHCHDWETALIPLHLHASGAQLFGIEKVPKTMLTIHNLAYQGIFSKDQLPAAGLSWEYFSLSGLEYYDKINLLKGGILYADFVNTVSLTYAGEVQTKEFGCGLDGVLAGRRDRFSGILNGVDYKVWNPQGDAYIAKNYSADHLGGKAENKRKLQEICGLAQGEEKLVVGFVGRLVAQKGTDLILKALPTLCEEGVQAVLLGSGDEKTEAAFADLAKRFPSQIFLSTQFDDILAHRIYAGADAFLMPSQFEPCGIGQMISFKYGTIPVVFKTGGLADTVKDCRVDEKAGTGFVFERYEEGAFAEVLKAVRSMFGDKKKWQNLVKRVMRLNFSWKESARKYVELYKKALKAD